MKKISTFILVLMLISGYFTGCKKDKGEPPVLPPAESMSIDFSNFENTVKSGVLLPGTKGTENSNYDFAATVVGYWRPLALTTLIVPITTFKLAIDQTPVYISEKNWQWSYNLTVAGSTYKARLTGQIQATDVAWKMYISKEGTGSFPEFVWFEGTSRIDGTGGTWTLNQSAASQVPLLQIDWTKTGTSVGTVRYTYVKNNDTFKTSYIEYGLTNNSLNAYYTIHYFNGVKFSEVNVEWNTTNHMGRVKCVDYLGDSTKWYCWNENKVNSVCL